jgi:hypothetical protein
MGRRIQDSGFRIQDSGAHHGWTHEDLRRNSTLGSRRKTRFGFEGSRTIGGEK